MARSSKLISQYFFYFLILSNYISHAVSFIDSPPIFSQVLLFSQWTMTLDLLEWYMKVKGFSYVRLDGSTNVRRA